MKRSQAYKKPTKHYTETDVKKTWYVFDAEGKTLSRLASELAKVLRGKHRPEFTPGQDTGDGVIVLNADKIRVTGNKEATKMYYRHSWYIGGLREIPYRRMLGTHPERVLMLAVKGMVPKNHLGRKMLTRLRIFKGNQHNMQAQQPVQVAI